MPSFKLAFTAEATAQLEQLEADRGLAKRLKAVQKALAFLQRDPRHPGLRTHKYSDARSPAGEVFEAYAENQTASAYRIIWWYGPGHGTITILAIIPHP
jgi:hypothetical protein